MPLEPGQSLSHYRLVEKIGEGGMGVVWKARDEKLRRDVALKVLPAELVEDPERRRRLLREARSAAAINHPNIAMVHEVDEAEGTVFIAMELVEGKTLRVLLGGKPLAIPEALRIAMEMAEGLAAAHQANVIHRDLKPENVLVRADGHVKVLDFGLAKIHEERQARPSQLSQAETVTEEMTREGRILGTPAYMAPEQARGGAVDARSDIFSFGTTLYEMVTGRAPFKGGTPLDTLSAILNEPALPPSQLNADVPAQLEQILAKCLEKDPKERYQDTQDLAVDLRKLRGSTETEVPAFRGPQRRSIRWPLALLGAVAIVVLIWGYLQLRAPSLQPASLNSLAVLPFANLSGDPDQEYFADGMTEALINALGRAEGLKVAARTSSFAFKGRSVDVREIGQKLGVATVVEGSIRKSGDDLRISAQLVDVAEGYTLWSNTYERRLEDVFAVQDEISRAITDALEVELVGGLNAPLVEAPTEDLEAYNLYLLGRHFWNRRTEDGIKRAIDHFERAIARAPEYAEAHVGLADAYCIAGFYDYLPPREAFPKGRDAARRAVHLDPSLASPHNSLGYIALYFDWDWDEAEWQFQRAIELDPRYPVAHQWYANFLTAMGRFDEAAREMSRGSELDPLSLINAAALGWVYYYAGQNEDALREFASTLELDPTFLQAHLFRGWTYEQMSRLDDAIASLEHAVGLSGRSSIVVASLARVYGLSARDDALVDLMSELQASVDGKYVPSYEMAKVHFALGRDDTAYALLERAYEERSHSMVFLGVDPQLADQHSDPRFIELLRKVGLDRVSAGGGVSGPSTRSSSAG